LQLKNKIIIKIKIRIIKKKVQQPTKNDQIVFAFMCAACVSRGISLFLLSFPLLHHLQLKKLNK
jgi:hypothetical protein